MYIEPFWCGVITVLLAEAIGCAILIAKAVISSNYEIESEDEV